jgi:hypothetical protein
LSRGYEGEIKVIEAEYEFSQRNIVFIILVELLLIFIAIYVGGDQFVGFNT